MKTKEQKRKEAIYRLLQALPKEREFMLRCQRIGSFTHQLFNKRGYKYTDSNITEEEQTYYGTPTYLRRVDAQVVLKLLEEATKIDFAD